MGSAVARKLVLRVPGQWLGIFSRVWGLGTVIWLCLFVLLLFALVHHILHIILSTSLSSPSTAHLHALFSAFRCFQLVIWLDCLQSPQQSQTRPCPAASCVSRTRSITQALNSRHNSSRAGGRPAREKAPCYRLAPTCAAHARAQPAAACQRLLSSSVRLLKVL